MQCAARAWRIHPMGKSSSKQMMCAFFLGKQISRVNFLPAPVEKLGLVAKGNEVIVGQLHFPATLTLAQRSTID